MKRNTFILFCVVIMVAWCSPVFAAQQSIPPSANLSSDGVNEGVTITAPATLTIDGTGGFVDTVILLVPLFLPTPLIRV